MIEKFGRDQAGYLVSMGVYAVHPEGHLIVVPPKAPLKAGFREATQAEVDAALKIAPPPAPAPAVGPALLEFEHSDAEEHRE